MRETAVTILLIGLLGGLFGIGYCRSSRAPAPSEKSVAKTNPNESASGMATKSGAAPMRATPPMGAASAKQPVMAKRPAADPMRPRPKSAANNVLGRPLRVVGSDWALLAPSLLANGGLVPAKSNRYQKARLVVTHRRVTKIADIATALAKGGADKQGADIALLSLPAFVAAFEQLQGLKPRIFLVLGRSHGREALLGRSGATLPKLPAQGPVAMAGQTGTPATLLGLFSLDLAGIALDRVRVLAPTTPAGKKAPLVARLRQRRRPAGERLLLSTAEVTRLIPFVAVCPAGFLEAQPKVLGAWARITLASARLLERNVPEAARRLVKVKGAPDLVSLVSRLGWVRYMDIPDIARMAGLSGRSAVSLYALFKRMWRLWREVGVLSTPVPEQLPLSTAVIAELVRSTRAPKVRKRPPKQHRVTVRSLFLQALPAGRFSKASFIAEVGLLAALFERSALEIWIGQPRAEAQKLLKEIRDRFALPAGQLVLGGLPRALRRKRPKASIRICQAR